MLIYFSIPAIGSREVMSTLYLSRLKRPNKVCRVKCLVYFVLSLERSFPAGAHVPEDASLLAFLEPGADSWHFKVYGIE
jgi:hypothetical protein